MKFPKIKPIQSKNMIFRMLVIALGVVVWQIKPTDVRELQRSTSAFMGVRSIPKQHTSMALAVIDKETFINPMNSCPQPVPAEVADFRNWAEAYLAAPDAEKATMLAEGKKLAVIHTRRIAELIPLDPELAITQAVPMVIRQDLPDSIVELLEERVNIKAALTVHGIAPLPGQETSPDFTPYARLVSTSETQHWNAYVYGKRARQRSLSATFINGIAVGKNMAVADSRVRQLEVGERPVPADREVVENCPISQKETVVARMENGDLPAVTAETPVFETAERVIFVCQGGHIAQLDDEYTSEEERNHWDSLQPHLHAGAGSDAAIAPTGAVPSSATTGLRSLLYIRVAFPDQLIDPQSEAECHDSLRQMSDWMAHTSYGRCYFTYTVAPLIVLPYPESWYSQYQKEEAGADTLIRWHALTLASAAGYHYESYNHEVIRWDGSVGNYAGSAALGGRTIHLKTNNVGTLIHEIGHNFGLWHANFWTTNPPSSIGPGRNMEYGNIFDALGNGSGMGQYTASFKNTINWLPNETFWTVNSPGVYRIHQFDSAILDPSRRYALRVKKDSERDYWAEFRQLHTTNDGFMNGLMLTWDRWGQGYSVNTSSPVNGSNEGAHLLDMTPGSFGDGIADTRHDSALRIGRTFSDSDASIHITPIAKNDTSPPSMDVYVHTGDVTGNLAPILSIEVSSTSVSTNANVTLTASATDPNGDPLAFAWVFDDGTFSSDNSAVQTKSWSAPGHYQVLCTASDMKGKRTTRAILVTVGSPTTFTVSGNITGPDGQPLEGVYVASHVPSNQTFHANSNTFHGTWTDSDGNYILTGLAVGSYTISPNLYPNVFTPSGFTNPVTVGPNATGRNFSSASIPVITLNVIDPVANEGATPGTGTIRIERTGSTATALSVQRFNTSTGSAIRNSDYTLSTVPSSSTINGFFTSQYIIPPGASFLDITITPVNDGNAEGTEYATLDFANTSSGYVLAGPAVARVEIADDDSPGLPVVRLTHIDNVASEDGSDMATLRLERNGSTDESLTVYLATSGTATNNADYTIPSYVVIPAGSASATFTLTPIDDGAQETTETVVLSLGSNAEYVGDTLLSSLNVIIHDNDLPVVTVVATDDSLTETSGDRGVFTISRDGGDQTFPLTVDYAIAGRAIHGADYRRLEGRAVIPAGAVSTTVEIQPYDDSVDEGEQEIILRLRSTTTYAIGGTGMASMSITDNDDSQFYVKLTSSATFEPTFGSSAAATYQIIRPAGGAAVTVNYAMSGTAMNGVDYTALPGSVEFAEGDTMKTITVFALADSFSEDTETVTLSLLPGDDYTLMISQSASATALIHDTDQQSLDVSAVNTSLSLTTSGSETSSLLRFMVVRKASINTPLVVNYTMAGSASQGVDYVATTGSVTIPANAFSAYIDIVPINDTIPEGVESIILNISPSPDVFGVRASSATLLLADDDVFGNCSLAFAAFESFTHEAIGTHQVPVIVTGSPSDAITVSYRVNGGTATGRGFDYTLNEGTLTFPPGTTSLNIPVTIHQDQLIEPQETIRIQIYNVSGSDLGMSAHTIRINNISMPEAFTDLPSGLVGSGANLNGRLNPQGLETSVWFEYGPTPDYGSSTAPQSFAASTSIRNVSTTISGLAPGNYHFRLVAQNSLGRTYGINQSFNISYVPLVVTGMTDDKGGAAVVSSTIVRFTVEFNKAMNASTVQPGDFGNAGTAGGVVFSVQQMSAQSFRVDYLPNSPGTLQFQINAGAILADSSSIALDTSNSILDDTIITVLPANSPPVATAQNLVTAEDTALPIMLTGSDADGDPLTYTVLSSPGNGSLSGTPPQLTYTPAYHYNGIVSFTFRVNDGKADSAIATVSISVSSLNDAPDANPQNLSTAEDTPIPITLTGIDVENSPLSYSIVSPPANGTLSGTAPNVTFTPSPNFSGTTSFTFRVNDGLLNSSDATVTIAVTPVNDAPIFLSNPIIAAAASEGMAYTGQTLKEQATDFESGTAVTFAKVSGPAWLVVAANGALSGTPPAGSSGQNSFIVRVTDSSSASADATLQINVIGLPLPWLASNIGTGMLAGTTTFNAGTFTQSGSGIIGSTSSKMRFTYQTLSGDGEIIARISALQNTGNSSRVGVMIRESLAANSREIFMGMSGSNAYQWTTRTSTGGSTTTKSSSTGTVPNTWVRLVRSGTTITAFKSTNGTSWTSVGSTSKTSFGTNCYIGIAVGSGSDTILNTSQFSNITVVP